MLPIAALSSDMAPVTDDNDRGERIGSVNGATGIIGLPYYRVRGYGGSPTGRTHCGVWRMPHVRRC